MGTSILFVHIFNTPTATFKQQQLYKMTNFEIKVLSIH